MSRFLLLLLCLTLAAPAVLAKPSATAVRIGVHPDKTRFVLELSEAPSYRVFTLPDPARVVVDLPELDWQIPADPLPDGKGLVEALRYGLFAPGTSRVVLDMSGPIGVKNVLVLPSSTGEGHRLVVDLASISPEVFADPETRRPILSAKPLPVLRQAALPVPPPKPPSDTRPTIVIDAGHGGIDPGAVGKSGTYEKTLALDYARELRRQLLETGRYRVIMTRDDDVFLQLRDRIALAQKAEGDLFISLHANTYANDVARGAAVYTLSEQASDKEAEEIAKKENTADIIAGVNLGAQTEDVSMILIDLAQRETMNLSKNFANQLLGELGQATRLLQNSHRFAGFAVLKSPTVPSILLEIGYMSNNEEERLLLDPAHRAKVSKAIREAIDSYFERQESLRRS